MRISDWSSDVCSSDLHASAIDSQISVSQARAAVDRQCRGAVTVAVVDESNADVVGEAEQARTLDQLPTPAVFGAHAHLDARLAPYHGSKRVAQGLESPANHRGKRTTDV